MALVIMASQERKFLQNYSISFKKSILGSKAVVGKVTVTPLPKVEHLQFKSAPPPPQLSNIADNQIGCGVAD
jgi:hypothetical protein